MAQMPRGASTACRDIQFQRFPNQARDDPTNLVPQDASRGWCHLDTQGHIRIDRWRGASAHPYYPGLADRSAQTCTPPLDIMVQNGCCLSKRKPTHCAPSPTGSPRLGRYRERRVLRPCDFAGVRREERALRVGFFVVAVFLATPRELAEAFRFRAPAVLAAAIFAFFRLAGRFLVTPETASVTALVAVSARSLAPSHPALAVPTTAS